MKVDYLFGAISLEAENARDILWLDDFLKECYEEDKKTFGKAFPEVGLGNCEPPTSSLSGWYKTREDILPNKVVIGIY